MRSDYQELSDSLVATGAGGVIFVQGPRADSINRHQLSDSWRPGRMEMQHSVIADLAADDPDIEALDLNRWYLASEYGADDGGVPTECTSTSRQPLTSPNGSSAPG